MQDARNKLEIDKILNIISNNAKTVLGKQIIHDLAPIHDYDRFIFENNISNEIISLVMRYGSLPIYSSADLSLLIKRAKQSGLLSGDDLLSVANDVILYQQISAFINQYHIEYPLLAKQCNLFFDLGNLHQLINDKIEKNGTVKDHASEQLFAIREKLKRLRYNIDEKLNNIVNTYKSYLADDSLTMRDGHYVLPIKNDYKNKVVGAIYDVSNSGNTVFIEPLEIINLNNEYRTLELSELEEERRIIKEITAIILMQEQEIISNNHLIAYFDALNAKALYAKNNHAILADISPEPLIDLRGAYHPLIAQDKAIKNDYYLSDKHRIVIISGPNAGGKTVSIKTVGTLTMMFLMALPITASKATLSFVNNVYVDIGDSQSLSANLSTFSAHIKNIAEIIDNANENDLLLFDELGTGTDPKQGESLAMAIVEYLIDKHCLAMISSHFPLLKHFASNNQYIDNASMLFDDATLSPTYKFIANIPGQSYALDVAKKYHLNEDIIARAKQYSESSEFEIESLIRDLSNKIVHYDRELIALNEEKKNYEIKLKQLENDRQILEKKRAILLDDVNEIKAAMVEEAKNDINNILASLNPNSKIHEYIHAKKQLDNLLDNIVQETNYNDDINVGDYVNNESLNIKGKVIAIKQEEITIRDESGLKITLNIHSCHKIDCPKINNKPRSVITRNLDVESISLELNLIGLRRIEAQDKLQQYLDNCRLKGIKRVKIIHGYGAGILRKMVHDYLAKQHDISFSLAGEYEGGSGVTIVNFK